MTPAEAADLILTAEGALQDARDAYREQAHRTAEPAPWTALTELTVALRHVGVALVAVQRAAEESTA